MAGRSITDRIQATLGIAKSELAAILILLGGLTAGAIIKYVIAENREVSYSNSKEITKVLDSLADAEAGTYTGVNDTAAIELAAQQSKTTDTLNQKYSADNPPAMKIDLNTATKEMLMKLPGIGTKTADEIISRRNIKPFGKISDLMEVKGIGPKKFEKVKSFIDVK